MEVDGRLWTTAVRVSALQFSFSLPSSSSFLFPFSFFSLRRVRTCTPSLARATRRLSAHAVCEPPALCMYNNRTGFYLGRVETTGGGVAMCFVTGSAGDPSRGGLFIRRVSLYVNVS